MKIRDAFATCPSLRSFGAESSDEFRQPLGPAAESVTCEILEGIVDGRALAGKTAEPLGRARRHGDRSCRNRVAFRPIGAVDVMLWTRWFPYNLW